VSTLGDKNVCRLNVTMNNPFAVSGIEGISNFNGQREDGLDLHWPPGNAMLQSKAVQKLHGDEGLAILLADIVNRANVRMVQGGRGLGLALKTGKRLRVAGNFLWQKLEGHKTVQPRVLGFVNHAHAAAAKLFYDAVVRNGLADHFGEE
jgi:hypothetical protein